MAAGAKSTLIALSILIGVAAAAAAAQGQTPPGAGQPEAATICGILRRPADFDGRIVTIRATVTSNFEIFAIRDKEDQCGLVWFTYASAGPAASVSVNVLTPNVQRSELALRRDREFARYERALEARVYPRERGTRCIPCSRYEVTATMTGRIDVAPEGLGFGHLNGFPVQFVLQRVTRVTLRDLASEYDPELWSTTPVRFPTGYIVGKVSGPDGRPISGIYVQVTPLGESPESVDDDSMETDEKGAFKIAVPPGVYTVAANVVFPPSAQQPYPRTWAPGTIEQVGAGRFSVADGRRVAADIRIPIRLAERKLRVRVTWPDGTPVPRANAWLAEQSDPLSVVGIAVSHTDAEGRVELAGLSGVGYVLRANIYLRSFRPDCSERLRVGVLDSVVREITVVLTRQDEACRSIDATP